MKGEVTIITTNSEISSPALLQTISFSQAFSSVNHPVTLVQAVSHLRRCLDGAAFTVRSGDTFLDTLKAQKSGSGISQRAESLHDILPTFPHRVRNGRTLQSAAARKNKISNLSHRLWDGQTLQRASARHY